MIPNDLHYKFPSAAYLGLAVFVLVGLAWNLYIFRDAFLQRFSFISEVITPRTTLSFWSKACAVCLAWIATTVVLMQPQGNGHYPEGKEKAKWTSSDKKEQEGIIQRKAHDVIFLVDASASMEVPDVRGGQTRFQYAKEIVDEIISKLKGESAALYAFTSNTTKLSPLTMDYFFVRMMLKQMHINEGDAAGTNMTEAFATIRDEYFLTITPKLKTVVILTDGGDTDLEELKGEERQKRIESLESFFNNAEELYLNVFTIGLGSPEGGNVPNIMYEGKPVHSSLDEQLLKEISRRGRGKYYYANEFNAADLANDFVNTATNQPIDIQEYRIKMRSQVKGNEDLIYDLFFQIPLGIALLLLGFVLLFPDTRKRI
ncbi:MAG TPA: VWA domain-containing protein [Waddliaceae bacterium]